MLRTELLFCSVGIMLLTASSVCRADVTEVRFAGSLSQSADGEDLILREFEALLLHSNGGSFFHVLDDEREGCPWPESFGQLSGTGTAGPHLQYEYDGNSYSIALPPLVMNLPQDVAEGATWTVGTWAFEATGTDTEGGQQFWKLAATERRGRRQSLKVLADNHTLLSGTLDVFMGQGDRFELTLKQVASNPLPPAAAERVQQLQTQLLALQRDLKRRTGSQIADLSPRQIEAAAAKIDQLTVLAKDTPLQEAVLRIRRNVERQQLRLGKAMNRQDELLSKPAPGFSLELVTGGRLESDSLAGKTVVLHFWKYAEKPLSEPYGQVGYLEFLYNKRKAENVQVVGIAMNPALQQTESSRSAKRTARKLIEFMNLSYPVGYDDGSLLRAFGDPRDSDGKLPLWVVITPAGKIAHYHGGFYEVDQRYGLKELDDVLGQ